MPHYQSSQHLGCLWMVPRFEWLVNHASIWLVNDGSIWHAYALGHASEERGCELLGGSSSSAAAPLPQPLRSLTPLTLLCICSERCLA
jgi:hypothetical protein